MRFKFTPNHIPRNDSKKHPKRVWLDIIPGRETEVIHPNTSGFIYVNITRHQLTKLRDQIDKFLAKKYNYDNE